MAPSQSSICCSHCNKEPASSQQLKICGRCKSVRYCSVECVYTILFFLHFHLMLFPLTSITVDRGVLMLGQRSAWPSHKAACKPPVASTATSPAISLAVATKAQPQVSPKSPRVWKWGNWFKVTPHGSLFYAMGSLNSLLKSWQLSCRPRPGATLSIVLYHQISHLHCLIMLYLFPLVFCRLLEALLVANNKTQPEDVVALSNMCLEGLSAIVSNPITPISPTMQHDTPVSLSIISVASSIQDLLG